jgi:hypothetical protein
MAGRTIGAGSAGLVLVACCAVLACVQCAHPLQEGGGDPAGATGPVDVGAVWRHLSAAGRSETEFDPSSFISATNALWALGPDGADRALTTVLSSPPGEPGFISTGPPVVNSGDGSLALLIAAVFVPRRDVQRPACWPGNAESEFRLRVEYPTFPLIYVDGIPFLVSSLPAALEYVPPVGEIRRGGSTVSTTESDFVLWALHHGRLVKRSTQPTGDPIQAVDKLIEQCGLAGRNGSSALAALRGVIRFQAMRSLSLTVARELLGDASWNGEEFLSIGDAEWKLVLQGLSGRRLAWEASVGRFVFVP